MLCEEFHCLPSQLDGEDIGRLMRIRNVRLYAKTHQAITTPGYANEHAEEMPFAQEFAALQLETIREFEQERARREAAG